MDKLELKKRLNELKDKLNSKIKFAPNGENPTPIDEGYNNAITDSLMELGVAFDDIDDTL
jgi:hypothetical protein